MATKAKGDVYTPPDIVEDVLDIAGYRADADIIGKKAIDPSCGDGAFLVEMARRLIRACMNAGMDPDQTACEVLECIAGIELVSSEAAKARKRIVDVCSEAGIPVKIDDVNVVCGNTLELYRNRTGLYDFAVGNPPYVRIHNIVENANVQSMSYCAKGMTDLYLAFYELGQNILASDGVLCYIAPSSWFSSRSGDAMRTDLMESKRLSCVVDLGHYQPFDGITTYTAIVKLNKIGDRKSVEFSMFNEYRSGNAFAEIPYDECWMAGNFVPVADVVHRIEIKKIMEYTKTDNPITVKNGFATNLDRFYMRSSFADDVAGKRPHWIREIVKASTAKWTTCFYPYDKDGTLLPLSTFSGYSIENELEDEKDALLNRNQVDPAAWWGYARSQGIADVEKDKVAVNTLYRNAADIKTAKVAAGQCVHGGVYVLGMREDLLRKALKTDLFMTYVKSLRKYKSGGYYTLSGKELERFLRWYSTRGN